MMIVTVAMTKAFYICPFVPSYADKQGILYFALLSLYPFYSERDIQNRTERNRAMVNEQEHEKEHNHSGNNGNDDDPTNLLLSFGEEVTDEALIDELRHRLWSDLLHRPTRNLQFPGSQPVSFTRSHLSLLQQEDYYVCEKSDGIRYLLYYARPYGVETAFLIDRNFGCKRLQGITLPSKTGGIHEDTLLDGELILERTKKGDFDSERKDEFAFLIFDALLINGLNIMNLALPGRLKHVQNDVVAPFKQAFGNTPDMNYPFRLDLKQMWKPYSIAQLLEFEIPQQRHGNDGLIFTPVNDPYVSGTCNRLLKWKPSEMNSVDFKLVINPDAKVDKRYELWVATQGGEHRPFAYHQPDERLVELHGKIIECRYTNNQQWEYIRVRKDKISANHERVVTKIIDSIKDNVTAKELIESTPSIRRGWQIRENAGSNVATMNRPIAKKPRSGW